MVAPAIIAAIIGGTAALGSAGIAAGATSGAAGANAAINQQNINATSRENFLQRIFAERILNLQLQPTTDAFGSRAEFIPGIGFTTTPAPQVKAVQDASLREQLLRLIQDAGVRREGVERSATRGRREDATATAQLDAFQRVQPIEENELFQLLLSQGTGAFNRNQDRVLQQVLRQNLRSGGSAESGSRILANFSAEAGDRRADIATNARLQALTGADEITSGRRNQAANLFNLFATRAQGSFTNTPFAPEQLSSGVTGLGQSQRGSTLGASQIAGALNRGTAPQAQFVSPDLGTAKFVGEAGTAISSLLKTLLERQDTDVFGKPFADRGLGNARTDPRIRA